MILGTSGFAFMAQNVQQPSSAGASSAAVNGYDVNDIHYLACGSRAPIALTGNFCEVQFKLVPQGGSTANTGTNVQAGVNGGNFRGCRYDGAPGSNQGTLWTCPIDSVRTANLNSLQVSAAQ